MKSWSPLRSWMNEMSSSFSEFALSVFIQSLLMKSHNYFKWCFLFLLNMENSSSIFRMISPRLYSFLFINLFIHSSFLPTILPSTYLSSSTCLKWSHWQNIIIKAQVAFTFRKKKSRFQTNLSFILVSKQWLASQNWPWSWPAF